jgi:hypothetical protein
VELRVGEWNALTRSQYNLGRFDPLTLGENPGKLQICGLDLEPDGAIGNGPEANEIAAPPGPYSSTSLPR